MEKKSSILAYILLAIFAIIKWYDYSYKQKELIDLSKYNNETFGIITEFDIKPCHKTCKYDMTIEYKIGEKNYTLKEIYNTYNRYGTIRRYSIGEKINILYNPEKPEYVIPKDIVGCQIEHNESYKKIDIMHIITAIVFAFIYYERTNNKAPKNMNTAYNSGR